MREYMNNIIKEHILRRVMLYVILFALSIMDIIAQGLEPPPVITVSVTQNLAFGGFSIGLNGGDVIIGSDGSRTVTGDLIALSGFSYLGAIYRVETSSQTLLSVLGSPPVTLTCPCGGSMTLNLGSSDPGPLFIVPHPPGYIDVKIGGTLTIRNIALNPAGAYTGSFNLTFVWE
jgi:hypothetical protein